MTTFNESASFSAPGGLPGALQRFIDEATELVLALISPNKLIAEVDRMRALQLQANRVEATDPQRAAELRRRASRILR